MYIHAVVNNEERIVGVFIRNVQECLTRYNYWRVYRVYRVYLVARQYIDVRTTILTCAPIILTCAPTYIDVRAHILTRAPISVYGRACRYIVARPSI